MNFFFKIKENPVFLISLAVVFVVTMCSEISEWIFNLLGVSENGESKCEALKFLGLGMFGILAVLLYSLSRKSAMKRFSKLHYLAQKITGDPLLSFLVFLLIVIFMALVGVLFFKSFEECIANFMGLTGEKSKRHEALKFLGIGMGGILVAMQALMSYRRATAMEKTAEAQVDAVSKTEDGLRQERLKNAIEHLGNKKDSVRLGGAYELFHLAKDAKEDVKELRQTVLDILCAHIRQTTGECKYRKANKSKPSEEVQSILKLLFVQEPEVFKGCDINLQGSWLNGADLVKAHLKKAVLIEAHLQGVFLNRARLQGASLSMAYLQGASLSMAYLQSASLNLARLQGAYLIEARLQGAYLRRARLQGAYLKKAQLQGADLFEAQLQGADLKKAQLQGAGSVKWSALDPFGDRIRKEVKKKAKLSSVVFAGGLSQEDVDSLVKGLSNEKAKELRKRLKSHIRKKKRHKLPKKSGAIRGKYTKKEANRWITDYKKAMSEIPKEDN